MPRIIDPEKVGQQAAEEMDEQLQEMLPDRAAYRQAVEVVRVFFQGVEEAMDAEDRKAEGGA